MKYESYLSKISRQLPFVTLFVLAAALTATAQDPDDVIRTETSLVQLNIGVVDRQGRPIRTLNRSDFVVYEDGVKQSIQHFEPVDAPFSLVLMGFLTLYLFRLIPPVPLSIPFIGVYHLVEKTESGYRLSDERPRWRFWDHGDQHFKAQPGDKIYVFFRIFSPAHFSDQVTMRWYWKPKASDWKLQDSIAIAIVGGRAQGFRGYGVKSNHQPGDWKVQVETTDGREIGRIYFNLESAPESARTFEVSVQ